MGPFTVLAPGYGAVTIDYEHDFSSGATRYHVGGARFSGVVTVAPCIVRPRYWDNPPVGLQVDTGQLDIVFGDGPPDIPTLPLASAYYLDRPNRPTVNGMRLVGALALDIAAAAGTTEPIRHRDLGVAVYRETTGRGGAPVPDVTADRCTAVLAVLARNWSSRPESDLARLRTAAAARIAGPLLATAHDEWASSAAEYAELTARWAVIAADCAALHTLIPDAAGTSDGCPCASEGARPCPPPQIATAQRRP
jgi:hypothetical protein